MKALNSSLLYVYFSSLSSPLLCFDSLYPGFPRCTRLRRVRDVQLWQNAGFRELRSAALPVCPSDAHPLVGRLGPERRPLFGSQPLRILLSPILTVTCSIKHSHSNVNQWASLVIYCRTPDAS